MKYIFSVLLPAFALCLIGAAPTRAQEKTIITDIAVVGTTVLNCNTDIARYCAAPSLTGNKRIMCLAAHEADLKPACKQGILSAAIQTELGISSLDYAYESCKNERVGLCGDVAAGEGRLLKCFKDNEAKISPDCLGALKNTGFWDARLAPAAGN